MTNYNIFSEKLQLNLHTQLFLYTVGIDIYAANNYLEPKIFIKYVYYYHINDIKINISNNIIKKYDEISKSHQLPFR